MLLPLISIAGACVCWDWAMMKTLPQDDIRGSGVYLSGVDLFKQETMRNNKINNVRFVFMCA